MVRKICITDELCAGAPGAHLCEIEVASIGQIVFLTGLSSDALPELCKSFFEGVFVDGVLGIASSELIRSVVVEGDPPAVIVLIEISDGRSALLGELFDVSIHTDSFLPVMPLAQLRCY